MLKWKNSKHISNIVGFTGSVVDANNKTSELKFFDLFNFKVFSTPLASNIKDIPVDYIAPESLITKICKCSNPCIVYCEESYLEKTLKKLVDT